MTEHPAAVAELDAESEQWRRGSTSATPTSRLPLQLWAAGNVTGFPACGPFGFGGFVVNCPVVSLDVNVGG